MALVNNKPPANGAAQLFRSANPAPAIEVPPAPVRAYLRSFQLAAVCVLSDGTVTAVRDIARVIGTPVAAWWTTPSGAIAIVDQCRAAMTTDIEAVAAALRVPLTPHERVIERATASVRHMADLLEQAKRNGSLQGFNRAYSAARAQARASGRQMMPYTMALDRLKRELYNAASGAQISGSIIAAALGIGGSKSKQT